GSRHAPVEGLGARDVRRILELACVHAQVAVRRVEERLQLVEREGLVDGEGTDDAQPDALVNRPVKLERTGKRLSAHSMQAPFRRVRGLPLPFLSQSLGLARHPLLTFL